MLVDSRSDTLIYFIWVFLAAIHFIKVQAVIYFIKFWAAIYFIKV